jgi:putative membrane protein (TIGR04086 family)
MAQGDGAICGQRPYANSAGTEGLIVLGVVRWAAVAAGIASGTLASAVIFLIALLVARLTHAEAGAAVALSLSLFAGLIASGYTAGRIAPFNGRFHGSITALGMAAIVIVVSRLSGSPAPTGQILLLALLAIVTGGIAGWLGGRRRDNERNGPTG